MYGKLLQKLPPGKIVGEKALIDNKPRSATVVTMEESEFLILYKEDFEIIKS